MRFRNFNSTEILTEIKIMSPRICLALAAFFVCLCPQTANAQAAQIKGYAVQVAALTSQQSADELVRGLSTRGINAYWVRAVSHGMASSQSQLHRVRIGNFRTIESAYTYAEQLLGSGLLDAYAIAAYEPPAKGSYISNGKVQSFAQKYQGRQFSGETIDMVAAIGTRGWLLLSSKSMNLTAQQGKTALSRELAKLAASVGSRGWSLQNNISKFLAAPAALPVNPANQLDLASNNSNNSLTRTAANTASEKKGTGVNPSNTPNVSVAPVAVAPVVLDRPAPSITSNSSASNSGTRNSGTRNTGSLNAVGPEINRSALSPAISTGAPANARAASSRIYTSPPRLQGSVEMRDGRMWMTLRNTDTDRSFSGMARVTLSDDKNQQDVTPMQFTLAPDKEESFPVDEATVKDGNWILMVYDQNGAARLIRGASLAPTAPPKTPGAPNSPNPAEQSPLSPAPQSPPSYVTGVFDATGWAQQPQSTPPGQDGAAQNGAASGSDASNAQNGNVAQTAPPQVEIGPGQVTVTPRQIAVTTENVTLEFEISAPGPLNYIIVTLRAGDFQDVRQALMSTPQGRVPFLVPAEHASAGFFYEVKDEAQRVLASGNGDFRRIAKGN